MKTCLHVAAHTVCRSLLCLLLATAWLPANSARAVALPPEVANTLQQRVDAFVQAPGYQPIKVEAVLDEDWYKRFQKSEESALPPDAKLDPVTRSVLLFVSQEAPLERARYRITRHQRSLGGEWSDIRHSYIEITRYNLAPIHHRQLKHDYGEHAAAAGPELLSPDVSWRLVTTELMGQRASITAASRRELSPFDASRALCLGLPCLALGGVEPAQDAGFRSMPAPELAPAIYRGWAEPPAQPEIAIAPPARIAEELFHLATGEDDELHEGASLEQPELVILIDWNSGGQDHNSQALLHVSSLMDDALSDFWIKRLEIPESVEWQRMDVTRHRRRNN